MPQQPSRTGLWVALILMFSVSALSGALAWNIIFERLIRETARRGDNVLLLATSTLAGQLDRFERLPALIADQPVVRDALTQPQSAARVTATNAYLERIQLQLGATDVYLMDKDGLTIAASNHAQEATFIGRNFAFRPDFSDAITGGIGRYYALGTTSQKRGYYFGSPVNDRGQAIGVLVFKVDLDAIEQDWRGGDYAVTVTDADGVIFLSGQQDWLFQTTRPLSEETLTRINQSRRYADTAVGLLEVAAKTIGDDYQILTIGNEQFVLRSAEMAEAGWQVNVLIDTNVAKRDSAAAAVVAMLSVGLLAMLGLLVRQQRARMADRLAL